MIVPGSNLLNIALSAIASQAFTYIPYTSRVVQTNGQYRAIYGASSVLRGSVQPVPRTLYQQYGLQFDKNYYTVFVSKNAIDVARDVSGDQISYGNLTMQVVEKTNWFAADGWIEMLCVQVVTPTPQQIAT